MIKKLLLTGATGSMGTAIRPLLAALAETVVVSGRRDITDLMPHEESRKASLDSADDVLRAVDGCDAIIHLGGYSVEGPFHPIMQANILGLYNIYEAARANGMPRILFASSNHVVGYHPQAEVLDNTALPRPDSLYGVSKVFGEALARFYFEKFGQQTAILRIGSCFDKPVDHRMLSTWLSYRDFVAFARAAFTVPVLGCPIVYGASANDRSFWDNSKSNYLGWQPQDNAEAYLAEVLQAVPNPDPNDPLHLFQGGKFTDIPILKEGNHD
ncbi:NAD-dependent epimerase/dehydratase family protein [Pseudoprimorskyibacter insulae]|uniref:NAD-dependent epimerase/dehydratase family protein n=1 Tax=Pseudoprimorskyibacter insulae TaxID=1695997 RepID=UPI001FE9C7B7|nr:NAD(P)-dependent oxidoreductase [Pseudoprimorskyibacter insulae]